MNDDPNDSWQLPPAAPLPIARPAGRGGVRRKTAVMATLVGLAGGGVVGGYMVARAATPTPSPSSSSSTSTGSSSSSGAAATATPQPGDTDGPGTPGGPGGGARLGGAADATEDPQTIATAIGITPAQLQTELQADGTIAAVAKAHNVDPAKVVTALVAATTKEIDAALAAGTLTQAQADSAKANAQQEATDRVNNTQAEGGRGGHGPGGPGGMQSEDLTVAAGALNIPVTELQTDLQNGQTIAAVAKAKSVDANTVISALVASENKEIDARVTSGQLTQAQADTQKQQTQQRVTDEVNGTHSAGRPGDNDSGSSSSSSSSTSSAGV